MNKRVIANILKNTFKLILLYISFVLIFFIGITIKNEEVKLLFKKEKITYSIYYKYYSDYERSYYSNGLPSRNSIQDIIIEQNFENSIFYSLFLIFFVVIVFITKWTFKFIKKYAD